MQENYAAKTVNRPHSKHRLPKYVRSVTFECSKVESHYAKNLQNANRNYCPNSASSKRSKSPTETQTQIMYKSFLSYAQLKECLEEMQGWASKVKKATKKAKFGIMAANNHYAGFGPAVLSRENTTPSSMKHLL